MQMFRACIDSTVFFGIQSRLSLTIIFPRVDEMLDEANYAALVDSGMVGNER